MAEGQYIQLKPPVTRKYTGKPVRVRESRNRPRKTSRVKRGNRKYTVRYGILQPNELSDRVLVMNNPNYGVAIGKHGSRTLRPCAKAMQVKEQETGFYSKLEASLKENGCINPVHALSIKEGTFCRYGTSRLWIARKLDIPVKVIITDFVGRWDHLEELETEKDVYAKFQDWPALLTMDEEEMRIDGCAQIHLTKDE